MHRLTRLQPRGPTCAGAPDCPDNLLSLLFFFFFFVRPIKVLGLDRRPIVFSIDSGLAKKHFIQKYHIDYFFPYTPYFHIEMD